MIQMVVKIPIPIVLVIKIKKTIIVCNKTKPMLKYNLLKNTVTNHILSNCLLMQLVEHFKLKHLVIILIYIINVDSPSLEPQTQGISYRERERDSVQHCQIIQDFRVTK
jgi:hypothetical protein